MARLSQFFLALVLVLTLLMAGAMYVSASAWFLWGLLPEVNSQLLIDTGGEISPLLTAAASRYQLADLLPFNVTQTRRFMLGVSENYGRLVIVPRAGQSQAVRSGLAGYGWKVQRVGFLLIAERGLAAAPDSLLAWIRASWQGLKQVGRAAVWQRLPARPILLAATHDSRLIPGLPAPSRLVGRRQRGQLQLVWGRGGAWPKPGRSAHFQGNSQDLLALVPGYVLKLLPQGLTSIWNAWLAEKLHFSYTHPNLMAALASFDHVIVKNSGENVTLGAIGNPEKFLGLAETWFSQEIAASQPVTAAFRLPDGTLGYEKRPGDLTVIFGPPGADGCSKSDPAVAAFRLCRAENIAFLIGLSDPSSITDLSVSAPNDWYIDLGTALGAVHASGSQSAATVELEMK